MTPPDFGAAMENWARRTPSVKALVLIGSRARPASDAIGGSDGGSDWDFQIVTGAPGQFRHTRWLHELGFGRPLACVARKALWGGGFKVNLAYEEADADLMIVPAAPMRRLRWLTFAGFHRRPGWTRASLEAFVPLVRPGWKFLKGGDWLGPLYRRAVAEIPDPRLDDAAIRRLAAGLFCDYRWVVRKIERGELIAAQRMLHLELGDVNFRLLHEWKLRRGEISFERARRVERTSSARERASVTIDARCDGPSLLAAAKQAAATCRQLVEDLTGPGARPDSAMAEAGRPKR